MTVNAMVRLTVMTLVIVAADCAFGQEQVEGDMAQQQLYERLSYGEVCRQVKILEAKVAVLTRWVAAQPTELEEVRWGINPILAELRAKRERIEEQLSAGLTTGGQMTEEHPKVIGWRDELMEIEEQIKGLAKQVVVNRVIRVNEQRLIGEREIIMMRSEIKVLSEERDRLAKRLRELNGDKQGAVNRDAMDDVESGGNNKESVVVMHKQMGQE